jgi:hypothetical protein
MTDTPTYSDDRKVLLTDEPGTYDMWEFRMRADACQKRLIDAIEGTDAEPTTGHNGKAWKAWKARQDAAAAMIVKGLDNSQIVYVRGLEADPHGMWEKLRMVHEPVGLGGSVGLWLDFFNLKYDGSMPMKTFLGHITGVAERLERFYSVKPSNDQIIAKMIASLPRTHSAVIRTLDSTDPSLVTLDFVQKKILVEDNTVRMEQANREGTSSADLGYGSTSTALRANADVTCDNCKGTGHTKANCWHKGGDKEGQYPDWWLGKRDKPTAHLTRVL